MDVPPTARQTKNERRAEEKRANDAWVPLLSHLLSLYPSPHSLASSLTSSSIAHSLSPLSCYFLSFSTLCCTASLTHTHTHTVSFSPLSPSPQTVTLCFIRSRCRQLREIECNMHRVWEKEKKEEEKKKIWSDSLTNCSEGQSVHFLQTLEHWECHTEFSLGLATFSWLDTVTYHCHWLLSALHLFIASCHFY